MTGDLQVVDLDSISLMYMHAKTQSEPSNETRWVVHNTPWL